MMSLSLDFIKMNGAGNDFVMLDNRSGSLQLTQQQINLLCDRHRGIGADGLLVLELTKSDVPYRMRYYNADGIEVEMCGNGARCFTRYVARLEKLSGQIAFQTKAGTIHGTLQGDQVQILMSTPFDLQLHELLSLDSAQEQLELHSINTGVPHAVLFVNDLDQTPVVKIGRKIRHHTRFTPAGTNVNFVQLKEPQLLTIRTYERGVEDETLACGTGVVASALIHHLLSGAPSPIFVITQGGDKLQIDFQVTDPFQITQVALTGPADFVFNGTISI